MKSIVTKWEKPVNDARYISGLQSVIRDLAKSSSIVVRGRGVSLSSRLPGILRVLIVAPLALRVKRVAESSKSDEQNAKKEIEKYDSSRREFIKRYFHEALENP